MNTETKTLECLVRLALQKQTHIMVSEGEIISALHAMQKALDIRPFTLQQPQQMTADLHYAADVLSNLLYVISSNILPVDRNAGKSLAKEIRVLHHKINTCLDEYCSAGYKYDLLPVRKLLLALSVVNTSMKQNTAIEPLSAMVSQDIELIINTTTMHYHRWVWWSRFVAAFNGSAENFTSFRNLLVKLNYNAPLFLEWLSSVTDGEIDTAGTTAGKINFITNEVLRYQQLKDLAAGYMPAENSVKQSMLILLKTKFCYLYRQAPFEKEASKAPLSKLNTALSVPQLALLIRLMVDAKIINETNQAALLKNVAGIISTSKANSVSPDSLRVNYYTPGIAAKNIVKEYLHQMIRLLAQY